MDSRESAIAGAISDYNNGTYTTISAAAQACNIPRTTLNARMKGRQNRRDAHHQQQRLTPSQEEFLVKWILDEESRGYPPSHSRARGMAARILVMNGDHQPLGKLWIPHFLERNPSIASIVGRKIECVRVDGTSPEKIRAFLELFHRTREHLNIRLEDIYNMDETGIGLGICTNSYVLASSKKRKAYKKSPESREWVSIIEAVSATGRALTPLIIFKGKSIQSSWFPSEVPNWQYTVSENGWTSNEIGAKWLDKIFLPLTHILEGHRMLILDGHGSHVSVEFLYLCYSHRVHLLFLPAHSSHVLQPLDLSCFAPVKSTYRKEIADLATLDDAAPVKKKRFNGAYFKARIEGLTERTIRSGWKAAGISPFNPEKVLSSSQISRSITPPTPRVHSLDDSMLQTHNALKSFIGQFRNSAKQLE